MRHGKSVPKLGRTAAHRKALMRNLATALLQRERISTTKEKARALRSYVEKLITRARVDSVHNKREVAKKIKDRKIITKLFQDIAPRYASRPGGYTRMYKIGKRPGDAADMVLIELVEEEMSKKKSSKKDKPAAKKAPKAESKPVVEETSAPAEEAPAEEPVAEKAEEKPAADAPADEEKSDS